MIRVAYVSADPGVPVYGTKGASVHAQEVLRALRRTGVRIELFAARAGGTPPPDLDGVPVHALPCPAADDPADRERQGQAANRQLMERLEQRGPFDVVYERYALWSYAAMEVADRWGAAGLLEVNAPLIDEQASHRTLVDRAGAEHATARAFAAADQLLAVSQETAAWARSWVPVDRVTVLPNGVDTERFRPVARRADGRFRIGFVGSLKRWHGVGTLIDAFALLAAVEPDTRLLVVGDGPEATALRQRAREQGVKALVTFTGAVPPVDVPQLLGNCDAAAVPYAAADVYFSPLKLYEYMAMGLPVVASAAGQVADVIKHGETGLLHRPGDTAAMATAFRRLRADAGLRTKLGRRARMAAVASHSWDRVAARILAAAGVRTEPTAVVA